MSPRSRAGEFVWLHVARDADGRIFSITDGDPPNHLDEDDVVTRQRIWIPAAGTPPVQG